ncbi:potassium transporter Kup [Ilumatobacter nonamiensis]|uniref:potassium transporter Kup n=1 Tax=Ilumatobacter nonamiensis TaxID=467093 RepID=UPI00034ABDB2|nr:KUP/HAK/KT family potassium transporter [Ilumatobacter nonamiensis]
MQSEHSSTARFALAFGTLGIVFGDIGTSPIYAFRESFEVSDLEVTQANAYGVASVVFWSLLIVISAKYLTLVMRADNHGEGGILALTALVMPHRGAPPTRTTAAIISLGVFGTALLYGDGLITPAISVLSAVEGFEVATTAFADFVIPVSIAILVALFAVQSRGTAGISRVFSPIMVVWFTVLGVLGARQIVEHPEVLQAASPSYGVELFIDHPVKAFLALGSVFLVVTGGEALYADMGHFGRIPITWSWYGLVLPCLLSIYFGQAALLGNGDGALGNPFYDMAPSWGVAPLAVLATCATVIASQALISGAFSLTAQAVQLDYFPRLAIRHTSPHHVGQVYVPLVNWLLMVGCISLILIFQSSSNLAAAYGIAVTTTMLITTLIFYRVVRDRWEWSAPKALVILIPFMIVDIGFLSANIPKIPAGGWLPLLVGFVLVAQMTTWRRGRALVNERLRASFRPLDAVLADVKSNSLPRVPGTAVYLFRDHGNAPPALAANVRHHRVLHQQVMLVSVSVSDEPHVGVRKRSHHINLADGVVHVLIRFGYLDEPDVPHVLRAMEIPHFEFDVDEVTYFLGRESVKAGNRPGMSPAREELFVLLHRGAASAARFYHLPAEQVVEVGAQVEL